MCIFKTKRRILNGHHKKRKTESGRGTVSQSIGTLILLGRDVQKTGNDKDGKEA